MEKYDIANVAKSSSNKFSIFSIKIGQFIIAIPLIDDMSKP